MTVIGIVGGVASGKSLVAQQLHELGATVVSGDEIGHEVLRDPQVVEEIRDTWGPNVIGSDGTVHRSALAQRVFGSDLGAAEQLERLEQMTHPRIERRIRERIEEIEKTERQVVVLDAAIMVKSGWDALCDLIVFVEVPLSERRRRVADRGWDASQLERRERAQTDNLAKRVLADFVIDNGGSPEDTYAQVQAFWNSLSHERGAESSGP